MAQRCISTLTRPELADLTKPNNQWGEKDGGPKQLIDLLLAKCLFIDRIIIDSTTVPNPDTIIERVLRYRHMKNGGGYQSRLRWIDHATITGTDSRPKQEGFGF